MRAKTPAERRHEYVLIALGVGVSAWAFFLVFENAFFAAPAFGVSPPSWSLWVGNLSLLDLNIIDTVAVALVVVGVVLAWCWSRPKAKRSVRGSRGSGFVAAILTLFLLVLAIYVLFNYGHVTLSSLWCSLKGFTGGSC